MNFQKGSIYCSIFTNTPLFIVEDVYDENNFSIRWLSASKENVVEKIRKPFLDYWGKNLFIEDLEPTFFCPNVDDITVEMIQESFDTQITKKMIELALVNNNYHNNISDYMEGKIKIEKYQYYDAVISFLEDEYEIKSNSIYEHF